MTENRPQDNSSLVGKTITIKLSDDKAFLLPDKVLNTSNLMYSSNLKRFKKNAFWEVQVLNSTSDNKHIHVIVTKYGLGEMKFTESQFALIELLADIENITFSPIDTIGLLETTYRNPEPSLKPITNSEEPQVLNERIDFKIIYALFVDGGVRFTYWLGDYKKSLEVVVSNHYIRKEFNAIKPYIIKALKTKYFVVDLVLQTVNDVTTCLQATSSEIDKINEDIIENIKYDLIRTSLRKLSKREVDIFEIDQLKRLDTKAGQSDHVASDQIDHIKVGVLKKSFLMLKSG